MTAEEERMVNTILAKSAKQNDMNIEDFVARVLPAFQASYENAKQDSKGFWEDFTPAGENPTIDEIALWMTKKLTMKQEELTDGDEVGNDLLARQQVRESFLDTLK